MTSAGWRGYGNHILYADDGAEVGRLYLYTMEPVCWEWVVGGEVVEWMIYGDFDTARCLVEQMLGDSLGHVRESNSCQEIKVS